MSRFASYDGTEIEFRRLGAGRPLVCLPGGPGRASEYLGDLGGLPGSRQLVQADTRGTGASASADPSTYRCDRLVADVEALRAHLGLERFDLLGHSAAGDLALLYAAAHPGRIDHLILLTPGLQAVGVQALIYAGELDFASTPGAAARAAELFLSSKVVVQPGTAHYPWLDDPAWFRSAIDSFLG